MYNHLKSIKKDYNWLLIRLSNKGYDDISKILLLTCDNKEKLTIYEKNIHFQAMIYLNKFNVK